MTIPLEQAKTIAEQFLGDLGVLENSEVRGVLASDDVFVFGFRTAAQALDGDTVLVVDRLTGDARFVVSSTRGTT